MYFKFGIFWNSSFENILKYFKQILQYNSKIAAEVKICINYQSCSYESTVNASKHSHFTVRLESLKEKRQALPRLSQFSKTTLNESTSRDSHLTVLHAFRPVNKQQKVTPVDLALGQHYLYTSGSVTRLTIFNGCTSLKRFQFSSLSHAWSTNVTSSNNDKKGGDKYPLQSFSKASKRQANVTGA